MSSNGKKYLQQAAAIPYRCRDGEPEFCLITSMRRGNWGFPKGIIDPGETPLETALKESEEEAGLHGQIEGEPVGRYEYQKWGQTLAVTVFLMRVLQSDETWLEADLRQRRWARADKVRSLLERPEVLTLFDAAVQRIACGRQTPA